MSPDVAGGGVGVGRLTLSALVALAVGEFRYYAPMLSLLVLSMALDYATGVARGYLKGELSSTVGLRGLVRKLCTLLAVCVGFAADLLVLTAVGFGLAEELPILFGMTATVLLTVNELLSVLENLGQIGVPLPSGLVRALEKLKQTDRFR